MENNMLVKASPHIRDNSSTQKIMLDVILALCPAIVASAIIFGLRALLVIAVTVAACGQLLRCVKRGRVLCFISAVLLPLILAGLLYLNWMTAASAAAAAGGAFLFLLIYWIYERNVRL